MSSSVWAEISFPAKMIDTDVQKQLEEEGCKFLDGIPQEDESYVEVQNREDGILWLGNGETSYGEFTDLENLLILKGIPFDREVGLDFGYFPTIRVFRPGKDGEPPFDEYFSLCDGDPVVRVKAIRELLDNDEAPASAIQAYLDEHFPAYSPLTDWVKEA